VRVDSSKAFNDHFGLAMRERGPKLIEAWF